MRIKKIFLVVIILIILIPIIFIFYFINTLHTPCGNKETKFIIQSGLGVNKISQNLFQKRVVCHKFIFETYLWMFKNEGKIKAGEYFLNKPVNIKELTKILLKGQKNKSEIIIKFIEGWNSQKIADYLDKKNIITKKDFLNKIKNVDSFKKDYPFLKTVPSDGNLEGFLFPDTYRIYKDATADEIIRKMLTNFNRKLTQKMRDDIIVQGKNIYQIITMASIIEKEVKNIDDMKIVSGIFWDRIKNGQPLESSATVGYVLGKDKIRYSYKDIKVKSPYNTYINRGLPYGPITNPSLQAIKTAIYPQYTDYNYFLSKPNGETVFSQTYKEHLKNSNKYLKKIYD